LLLNLLCTVVPPQVIQQNRFRNAFRMLLAYMMLLAAVISPPNLNIILPITLRLDPLFLGFDFRGRDVFTSVENQRHLFWLNTGQLPETLEDIVFRLTPVVNGVFFLMPWGCIDGTPHEIYRPQVEPQAQFYSGHRHYHVMNTQLIVDNQGNIVFLQAGFLGSMNDAGNFILMDRIGPGTACDMPRRTVLLADKGYGDFVPLLTPF
ncbi:unnamed protein product, partial [Porites evermanni]